jgi:hypothetical protein
MHPTAAAFASLFVPSNIDARFEASGDAEYLGNAQLSAVSSPKITHTIPRRPVINITYDSSVDNAPAAFKAAVADVVAFFESVFTNPITINIDVGYGEVDGQKLGRGLSERVSPFSTTLATRR